MTGARDFSRRQFALLAGSGLALGRVHAQARAITARQIVERIQKDVGVPWRAETVDVFKSGDPETPVKGIAATFMATFGLLQRAAAAGRNFVITHEPTFWNHLDNTNDLTSDPLYRQKQDFIRANNMVIWRFHDHLHARQPDAIFQGLTRTLGWQQYQRAGTRGDFDLPETTLENLARQVQARLKTRSMRVIGDPRITIRTASYTGHDLAGVMRALANFDVLIAGEVRESDTPEYLRDVVATGGKKALLLLAHERLEEFGMEDCAQWLASFIKEVPIEYMPSGEPYYIPTT